MEKGKIVSWYDKIVNTIEGSKNKLHIDVCINMISQFYLRFPEEEDLGLLLKIKLDEQAVKLGLLVV